MTLHAVLFLFGFGQATGELISGGSPSGGVPAPTFAVTLVGMPPSGAEGQRSPAVRQRMKIRDATEGLPQPSEASSDGLRRLAVRLRTSAGEDAGPNPAQAQSAKAAATPLQERPEPARGHSPARGGDGPGTRPADASAGDLWGAIAPCWRDLRVDAKAPVTVELTLDSRGRLAGPPILIRPVNAALNEARLKSEAHALEALKACLPRAGAPTRGRTHRIEFPAS